MSTADLTGAHVSLELGDTELSIRRLTDKDITELDEWVKSRIIQLARASLSDSMTSDEREEFLGIAMRQAMRTTFLSGDGAKMMASLDGLARIVYQGLVDKASMSFEDIRSALLVPENVRRVGEVVKAIRPQMPGSATSGTPGKSTQTRRKRSKKKSSTKR